MNEFYVYLHKKADTGEVFYVGKGKACRAFSRQGRSEYWNRVAKKHGFTVEILADGLCEASAFEYECFKIKKLRETGISLVNLTEGGEGSSGAVRSLQTRMKMREAKRGEKHPFFGKPRSDETKRKISQAQSGEKHPFFGKTGEKHNRSKPVLQFSKDGTFIKEWPCTMEVERVLKIHYQNISKCSKGKRKAAGGFIWKYKE